MTNLNQSDRHAKPPPLKHWPIRLLLLSALVCIVSSVAAQKREIDSLKRQLAAIEASIGQRDTGYINTLNGLASKYWGNSADTMLLLSEKAAELAQQINHEKGLVDAKHNTGASFLMRGDYDHAIGYYYQALSLAEKIGYKTGEGKAHSHFAIAYLSQNKFAEALESALKALEIREELGDKRTYAATLNNIAYIYHRMGQLDKSLETNLKVLRMAEGGIPDLLPGSLNSIGGVYVAQGKYRESIESYERCLKLFKEKGLLTGEGHSEKGLAEAYLGLKDYDKALKSGHAALRVATQLAEKELIKESNETLSRIYEAMGNYQKAHYHYKQFKVYADSTFNLEIEKKTAGLQAQYEFDKKTAVMKAEQAKKDAEQESHRNQLYWLIFSAMGGLITTSIILFLIFRSRKKIEKAYGQLAVSNAATKQAKEELEAQAEELTQANQALQAANHAIDKQNKYVRASINVAYNIQAAMLPFSNRIDDALGSGNYFVLFKPRDIVSGDFYFFEEIDEKLIIAVADCTGHGVPGAFMSMIGINLLEGIVKNEKVTSPGKILYQLNRQIRYALKQDQKKTREGMDMSIVCIDREKEEIAYAGAMNPLYYVENGELKEIKATKKPIGGLQTDGDRHYEEHAISFAHAPLFLYLCTDGYQDQFGGSQNKKFMAKALKELLLSIHEAPVQQQRQQLDEKIEDWRKEGGEPQIDDITIMGVRISPKH